DDGDVQRIQRVDRDVAGGSPAHLVAVYRLVADRRVRRIAEAVLQLRGGNGDGERLSTVSRLDDHHLLVEVVRDFPLGVVLRIEEVDVERAVRGDLGI